MATFIGSGAGGFMMEQALRLAWRDGVRRVWLHTCTFDSPQALGFYQRFGFVPYQQTVEIEPDPRLPGAIPAAVGPRVPVIGASGTVR